MKFKISFPNFDSNQKRIISENLMDLGKFFFAGGIVGFIIPGTVGNITFLSFLLAIILSLIFFYSGIKFAGK